MNSSAANFKNLWKPLLVAAALAFLYANVLARLIGNWWTDENYSHGLLVPFVIGFIVWSEWDELGKIAKTPKYWLGGSLIVVAILLLLGGSMGAEIFTQRVSLALMLVGIVVYFFGSRVLRLLVAPFVLLLLAIPIPQIIFNKIAFPLQIWASQMAVWGIRLFEVPTLRKGNVIEILPQGATEIIALEVVEACSGIRSLMTLATLALVLAYFTRDEKSATEKTNWKNYFTSLDLWRAALLMLAAIPIAVLTNAARVTATGVLTFYYGQKAATGVWHDLSGWLVYLAALVLLIAFNSGLKFVSRNVVKKGSQIEPQINTDGHGLTEDQSSKFKVQKSITGKSVYFLLALLLFGGVVINWFELRGETPAARINLNEFPQRIDEWQQKGDAIRFGEQTESVLQTSDYTMREYVSPDGRLANVYVGYYASQRAGATYHSPQNCLPGAGWVMRRPELVAIKTPNGTTFQANRYIVENGNYKEVMLYWYQGRGRFAASEYEDKFATVRDSIWRGRSDGALVRVMTSAGTDEPKAFEAAADLSAQIADQLSAFVPE